VITSHARHLHIRRFAPIVVPSAVVLTRQLVPRGVKRQRPTSLQSHRRPAAAAADDDDDVTIIADYGIISASAFSGHPLLPQNVLFFDCNQLQRKYNVVYTACSDSFVYGLE